MNRPGFDTPIDAIQPAHTAPAHQQLWRLIGRHQLWLVIRRRPAICATSRVGCNHFAGVGMVNARSQCLLVEGTELLSQHCDGVGDGAHVSFAPVRLALSQLVDNESIE
jgi:hypothetical protein